MSDPASKGVGVLHTVLQSNLGGFREKVRSCLGEKVEVPRTQEFIS